MLYNIMLEAPSETDAREQYISRMDETFFAECELELTKINLFFSQKIGEHVFVVHIDRDYTNFELKVPFCFGKRN